MYHIVAAQRHRQYGAFQRDYHAAQVLTLGIEANAQCLIELAIAIFGGVSGVEQQMELAAPGGIGDPIP